MLSYCQFCEKRDGELWACAECREVAYCGPECQDAHIASGLHDFCPIANKGKGGAPLKPQPPPEFVYTDKEFDAYVKHDLIKDDWAEWQADEDHAQYDQKKMRDTFLREQWRKFRIASNRRTKRVINKMKEDQGLGPMRKKKATVVVENPLVLPPGLTKYYRPTTGTITHEKKELRKALQSVKDKLIQLGFPDIELWVYNRDVDAWIEKHKDQLVMNPEDLKALGVYEEDDDDDQGGVMFMEMDPQEEKEERQRVVQEDDGENNGVIISVGEDDDVVVQRQRSPPRDEIPSKKNWNAPDSPPPSQLSQLPDEEDPSFNAGMLWAYSANLRKVEEDIREFELMLDVKRAQRKDLLHKIAQTRQRIAGE